MSDKVTMCWETIRRGQTIEVREDVNLVADARSLAGTAGFPWVIMAANPNLSSGMIERYLNAVGGGAGRSLSWIKRHRWMFRLPDAEYTKGPKANEDGNLTRALKIMHANTNLSARQLVYLLKDHRIHRSREWVRKHRCDPVG